MSQTVCLPKLTNSHPLLYRETLSRYHLIHGDFGKGVFRNNSTTTNSNTKSRAILPSVSDYKTDAYSVSQQAAPVQVLLQASAFLRQPLPLACGLGAWVALAVRLQAAVVSQPDVFCFDHVRRDEFACVARWKALGLTQPELAQEQLSAKTQWLQ